VNSSISARMKVFCCAAWKRSFDILASTVGLIALSPVLVVAALAVRLDSPGRVIFCQDRVGRGFRTFSIYKFRTMTADAPLRGGPITVGGDPRITRIGKILRRTKIDELPQLFNVLRGDMSIVGPRPEVSRYVELFHHDYEEILRIRPGITDPASLKYPDEASLLQKADDPEREYLTRILPDKLTLSREYVRRACPLQDVALILKTLARIAFGGRWATHPRRVPAGPESDTQLR